mgnify:CR=1 FL=1
MLLTRRRAHDPRRAHSGAGREVASLRARASTPYARTARVHLSVATMLSLRRQGGRLLSEGGRVVAEIKPASSHATRCTALQV